MAESSTLSYGASLLYAVSVHLPLGMLLIDKQCVAALCLCEVLAFRRPENAVSGSGLPAPFAEVCAGTGIPEPVRRALAARFDILEGNE